MRGETGLTLYLGGTRSGKSAYAEAYAQACSKGGPVLYVATAVASPDDTAMRHRIACHRKRRPAHWHTLECPLDVARAIAAFLHSNAAAVVLLDCVTLWMTNILLRLPSQEDSTAFEAAVRAEVLALLELMESRPRHWVLVSGEVGLGGIGATPASRMFCDGLGLANQLLAQRARQAFLVVAGRLLPLQ